MIYNTTALHPKDKTNHKIERHKFSKPEDERLTDLVYQYGTKKWRTIASLMEDRTPRQCRERWKYYLNPDLKVGNWTEEEDDLIIEKRDELGPKWMKISKFFQNRTDAMIKNRYKYLIKNGKTKPKNKRFLPQNNTSNNSKSKVKSCFSIALKISSLIFLAVSLSIFFNCFGSRI